MAAVNPNQTILTPAVGAPTAAARPLGVAPRLAPRRRIDVVLAELDHLTPRLARGPKGPAHRPSNACLPAPSLRHDLKLLWRDADYRSQLRARLGFQLGQGLGSGLHISLIGMASSLTAAQGLLANSCIHAAEMLVQQTAGVWRGLFSDNARNGSRNVPRHRLVSRVLLAGLYELAIGACLLGVLLGRHSRYLRGRRLFVALTLIRMARIFCQASQGVSFDGLKGQLQDPAARKVVTRRWDSSRAVEAAAGLGLSQAAAIACQLLPYAMGVTSVPGAMACMMGAGLVVSMVTKLQLCHYLDEGKDVTSTDP